MTLGTAHRQRLGPESNRHAEDFKLPVGRRDPWVVLVLSCASSSLLESDFLRLAPQGQHVEGWVSGLKKVLQAHDPNTNEPLGQYYLFFENIGAADAYREEAARLHSLWRQQALPSRPGGPRMTTTTMTMTPTATSTTATSAAASERPHAFSLVPPTADLDLGVKFYVSKTVNELAAKTTLQGVFYLRSGLPRTERTARVLLALAGGAQLALGAVRAAIEEDGRERNLAWRLAARRGDRSGVAPLRRNADGPADEGERGSRFLVTFADADDAPRFVRSWHKRRVEEVYEEGKKRSVVVDAMVIW
ncbi:hypothetical protein NKR23_g8157 [Pleurostoma richardsiae]|uniref:Uncharacterized protein n=1 Tax=Pleurostoma richardsiae TaxID=41990 RepID=A0AA38RRA3_9PEZI|nr:hypothetical protein NKR23_g8157 [Pleurostoma richardsiae]